MTMTIPADVRIALETALDAAVVDTQPVHGGDINEAARLTLRGVGALMLKWNRGAGADFFQAEAHGLRALAGVGAIRVPGVLAVGSEPPFLALEWIEQGRGGSREHTAEQLGRGLAALHRCTSEKHGLERDNYIGSLPQPNAPSPGWIAFYRDRRIGAQMAVARHEGMLSHAREDALTRLQDRLADWLDDSTTPSLLHGDLWGGNHMAAAGGEPVLIDPAVYYGHREVDLAMTQLFGGFPPRFYAAYHEAYPLDPGYEQRRLLYQLYYLMVHMNLFGGGYAAQVDSIVRRYVG